MHGSMQGTITFRTAFNDAGIASGVKKFTLRASVAEPMLIEIFSEIATPFNAVTTNVLTMGTSVAANELLSAVDITEGTLGFYPAANANIRRRIIADTDIWVKYTQSGAVATAGIAFFFIRCTPLAPVPTNAI